MPVAINLTSPCPKVVVGHNYITDHGENTNVIVIPFQSPIGEFILDISVKSSNGAAK